MKGTLMFLAITFLLVALCSLNASGLENSIPDQPYTAQQHLKELKTLFESLKYKDHELDQPYTAQQHLKELKTLFESLKYKDHEIGFFSFNKKKTNQTLDRINHVFEERLKKESNRDFLLSTTEALAVILKTKLLPIPPSKAFYFLKTIAGIVKKRDEELDRWKKEDQNMVNLEKNSEDHKND